jgi:RHS repeat-associated protein
MKLPIASILTAGIFYSAISAQAQTCGDGAILKPRYLELSRTITESPFVGVREFVQSGTWPEYYREIQYSGNWDVSEHQSTWICQTDPLNGGPVSVELKDSALFDVKTGQLIETGLATQTGFSSPSPGTVDLSSTTPGGTFPRSSGAYIRLYVNPFGLTSETSTSRVWSQLPGGITCSGGFMYQIGSRNLSIDRLYGRNITGSVEVTLFQNDTIEDALSNWSTRSGGSQVTDFGNDAYLVRDTNEARQATLEIKAEFEGCVNQLLTIHMITEKTDLSTNQSSEDEQTFSVTVDSNGRAVFDHSLEAALNERIALVRLFATEEATCSKDIGNPYSSDSSVNSLHWYTSIGSLNDGQSAGQLRIDKENWSGLAYTPADLSLYNPIPTMVSVIEVNDVVRQVLTPNDIVDVVTLGADSYQIDIYDLSSAGAADLETGIFTISGSAHTSYTLSKQTVGSEHRLRIVETASGSSGLTEFAFSSAGNVETWTLYSGSGAREFEQITEELSSVPTGLEATDHFSRPYVPTGSLPEFFPWTEPPVYVSKIEQVKNSDASVVSKTERIYQEVTLGSGFSEEFNEFSPTHTFELFRRERVYTDNPTAPEYEVTYFYGTDDSQSDFMRLVRTENSRGDWEKRRYDNEGRIWQVESSYLGSAVSDPASSNRLLTHVYSEVADMDNDGEPESLTTRTESLLGSDISRNFELELSGTTILNGVEVSETREIVAFTPSASWDTAGNLVTRVWEYADEDSEFYTEEYARSRPDGTGSIHLMLRNGDNTLTVTELTGALNSRTAPTAVTAGLVTVKAQDSSGSTLSSTTTDAESSLIVAQTLYTDFDHYDRAQRIDYLDGSYETRQYACCGLQSVTGRDGVTTTFDYDDLKRVDTVTTATGTADQQVERRNFDVAGNLRSLQVGSDENTLNTITENDYDYSGALTATRERYLDAAPAVSRETTFAESINASGFVVNTTTYPNGSTRITKEYPSGELYETTGSAVRNARYSYDVQNDATLSYPVRIDLMTYLDAAGTLTSEYSKTYRDALGRNYKSERPASDGSTASTLNTYNSLGQLASMQSPDSQVVLYTYNAEGEREVTASDLNLNAVIDYDGTDRITRAQRSFATRTEGSDHLTVQRTTSETWGIDSVDTPEIIARQDTTVGALPSAAIGTISWSTTYGQTTVSESLIDRASATITTTTTLPDSSYQIEVATNGLLQTRTRHHSDTSILSKQTYTYDNTDENRLDSVTDLYNGLIDYAYYGDGQLKSTITPDPDIAQSGAGYDTQLTSYAYTDNSTQISRVTTLPDLSTQTEIFYPTGELKEKSGSQTYSVAYTYDYAGRPVSQTTWQDKAGNTGEVLTAWEYYANGSLKKKWYDASIAGDGTISGTSGPSYTYTDAGRLLTKTNAGGTVATYAYDPNSLDLTGVTYDDGITPAVSYSNYDRLGRVGTVTDASGTRTLDYEQGALLDETYTAGALAGYVIDRDLDSLNRYDSVDLKSHTSSIYTVGYNYDGASRLQAVHSGDHTVTYSYDPSAELRQTRTFNNGSNDTLTVEERRDKLGRLKSLQTLNQSLVAVDAHTYLYNDLNQRTRHTDGTDAYWDYSYDERGQVETAVRKTAADVTIPSFNYGYAFDDIGNRTQTTTNGRTASYTPDILNQYDQRQVPRTIDVRGSANAAASVTVDGNATTRQGEAFHHALDLNAGGNAAQQQDILVTATLPDGGDNNAPRVADAEKSEYLPPNPEDFTYDADGNLTQDGKWFYTWNAENRLIEMETVAAAVTAGAKRQKLEFDYDSQGRRFGKTVYYWDDTSSLWSQSSSLLCLYDGWNLIAEFKSLQTSPFELHTSYVWGTDLSGTMQGAGGVGGLLMVTHAQSSTFFPAFDGNGNVMGYYAADTGGNVVEFEYGPFGELIRATGSKKDDFNFGFSTKYQDAETGMFYYGFRYYNPVTGRWLSRDPIGENGGLNLYGMVGNNPISKWDYLGLAYRERLVSWDEIEIRRISAKDALDLGLSFGKLVKNLRKKKWVKAYESGKKSFNSAVELLGAGDYKTWPLESHTRRSIYWEIRDDCVNEYTIIVHEEDPQIVSQGQGFAPTAMQVVLRTQYYFVWLTKEEWKEVKQLVSSDSITNQQILSRMNKYVKPGSTQSSTLEKLK